MGAVSCTLCSQPIGSQYYALAEHVICPACCERALAPLEGSGFLRFLKATVLGIGAGLIGAAIWFAIRRVAGMELGLVALLVGFLVGKAVHKGAGNKGGLGYQLLAVAITYCCIAVNYMPDIVEGVVQAIRNEHALAAAEVQAGVKAAEAEQAGEAAPRRKSFNRPVERSFSSGRLAGHS